jgi:hypothetical protein
MTRPAARNRLLPKCVADLVEHPNLHDGSHADVMEHVTPSWRIR